MRDAAAMTERRVRRIRTVRWRDARLWVGVGLVVTAMVIGARVLASGDDHILVWAAMSDMAAGSQPTQVEPVPVALGPSARHYFPADQPLPGRLLTAVTAGALIPRDAVTTDQWHRPHRFVSVVLDSARMPHRLAPGIRVDVWATNADEEPVLVLPDVLVEDIAEDRGGVRGGITVILNVAATDVGVLLAAIRGGEVDLIAVPLP